MKHIVFVLFIALSSFYSAWSQKVISLDSNSVVFTQKYFQTYPFQTDFVLRHFTPKIDDVRSIEILLEQSFPEFKYFKKQYVGEVSNTEKRIKIILIPPSVLKRYPKWQKALLNSIDNISLRYAYYNLTTLKLEIEEKSKMGG